MRLKTFLDKTIEEAIVTPVPIVWKDLQRAIETVYDKMKENISNWFPEDLHQNLEYLIRRFSVWADISLKHNDKINRINATTTVQYIKEKGRKNYNIQPQIKIYYNKFVTFEKWHVSIYSKRAAVFNHWLNEFKATAYHEMVHAGQLTRWWNNGRGLTPDQFEKQFESAVGSFSKWLADKHQLIITNYEKYHADGLEIMAFAQGAAIDIWKWGSDFKEQVTKEKKQGPVKGDKPLKNLAETGDVGTFIIERLKNKGFHSTIAIISENFKPYWEMRKKYPTVWKKFMKYLVQYIEHHSNISESRLNELFTTIPETTPDWWGTQDAATVGIGDTGTSIIVQFKRYAQDAYTADFSMKKRGKANPMEIFLGAAKTIGEFIKRKKPTELAFYPADIRRSKIYIRILSKFLDTSKWDIKQVEDLPFMRGIPSIYIKKKSKKGFEIEKYT